MGLLALRQLPENVSMLHKRHPEESKSASLPCEDIPMIADPDLLLLLLLLGRLGLAEPESLRTSINALSYLLPRRGRSLKVSERLCELQGLADDSLLLLIVPDLGIALCFRSEETREPIRD